MVRPVLDRLRHRLFAPLLVFAVLLTACSPPSAGDRAADESTPVAPVWQTEGTYLSSGSIYGDRVLAVSPGAEPGRIDLVGLDIGTGRELWRYGWSPNGALDMAPRWTVIDRADDAFVVFVEDGGEPWGDYVPPQSLVSVRLSDGRRTVIEERVYMRGYVDTCGPEESKACVGIIDHADQWIGLEIDPDTGVATRKPLDQPHAELGGGLQVTIVDTGAADPDEELRMVRDGRVLWTLDSRETFGRTILGAQTAAWDRIRKGDGGSDRNTDSEAEDGSDSNTDSGAEGDSAWLMWVRTGDKQDLGASLLTAVSATGEVLWQRRGMSECLGAMGVEIEGLVRVCEGWGQAGAADARFEMVLLDPMTGYTVRRHRLDPPETDVEAAGQRAAGMPTGHKVVTVDGTPQVLDTRTGALTPFDPTTQLCWDPVTAAFRGAKDALEMGYRVVPCAGEGTDRTLPRSLVEQWTDEAEWVTVLRGDKIFAYRR